MTQPNQFAEHSDNSRRTDILSSLGTIKARQGETSTLLTFPTVSTSVAIHSWVRVAVSILQLRLTCQRFRDPSLVDDLKVGGTLIAFWLYVAYASHLQEIPQRYPNIDLLLIHLGGTSIPGPHAPLLMVVSLSRWAQGCEYKLTPYVPLSC